MCVHPSRNIENESESSYMWVSLLISLLVSPFTHNEFRENQELGVLVANGTMQIVTLFAHIPLFTSNKQVCLKSNVRTHITGVRLTCQGRPNIASHIALSHTSLKPVSGESQKPSSIVFVTCDFFVSGYQPSNYTINSFIHFKLNLCNQVIHIMQWCIVVGRWYFTQRKYKDPESLEH